MAAYRRERAVLESGVALIDRSGDATLRLDGPGADAAMRALCGVTFDTATPARFLAPMLDAAGGVQALPWALRGSDGAWILLAAPDAQRRLESWIRRNAPRDEAWTLDDIGADHALIELAGPRAHETMAALSATLAELSWRPAMPGALLLRADRAVALADAMARRGAVPVGLRAADGARVERRIPRFGREASPAIGAVAAGLDRDLVGTGFIGHDAVRAQRAAPPARTIRQFAVARDGLDDLALEPLVADGAFAGHVTSSALATSGGETRFFALVDRARRTADLRLVLDGAHWPIVEIASDH